MNISKIKNAIKKVIVLIKERRMPDRLKFLSAQYAYFSPAHLLYKAKVSLLKYLSRMIPKTSRRDLCNQNKVILLTTFYKESNVARLNEYKLCLEYNILNPFIYEIHVFYENMHKVEPEKFLLHPKVKLHNYDYDKNGDLLFRHYIDFANNNLKDTVVIISNTDIYFDDSLKKLYDYDLAGKVLALTRYNDGRYGFLDEKYWSRNTLSQDSWIFKAPIRGFDSNIVIGWLGSDNRIAYEMSKSGLEVTNPSLDIKTWHIHKSSVRPRLRAGTYQRIENFKQITLSLPFCRLG